MPFYGIPEHAKPLLEKPTAVIKLKNVVLFLSYLFICPLFSLLINLLVLVGSIVKFIVTNFL